MTRHYKNRNLNCVQHNLPLVILKQAISLDGYLDNKRPVRFSNDEDRRRVHIIRSMVDAILVGATTIRNDNPSLVVLPDVCGLSIESSPIRVVIEGTRILEDSNAVLSDGKARTLVFRNRAHMKNTLLPYEEVAYTSDKINMIEVCKALGVRGVRTVLVEGGAQIVSQMISHSLVGAHRIAYAPRVISNTEATSLSLESDLYAHIKPHILPVNEMFEAWYVINDRAKVFYERYVSLL